jgi:ergothioneine biosynthesis protein EgtB
MLLDRFREARERSLSLVAPLELEDFVPQAAVFASPPKWNLAHTSWFFEDIVLLPFLPAYRLFHPQYRLLFNSYYHAAGERLARDQRGLLSRPTVADVLAYRRHVDEHMQKLFAEVEVKGRLAGLIELGINHEEQHQELFYTDIKYNFSVNPLLPAYVDAPLCEDSNSDSGSSIVCQPQLYRIGHEGDSFHFDNESKAHDVQLSGFRLHRQLVTNGEFMEFIAAGGYDDFRHWHSDGWAWKERTGLRQPLYWHKREGEWWQFTLAGLRPLQKQHILCHISYYEAASYAAWRGLRLPTEFEWEAAAGEFTWGQRWEWTESAYLPYPGYRKAEGIVAEYNGKFMVNQKVLRGASVATVPGHSRKTYRNFFHPGINYQFSGIRLAEDII